LPLIPLWVQILKVPYKYLFPCILLIVLIGAYTLNNSLAEVMITIFFGFIGYVCRKFKFDIAPIVLALVLGPILETALRRSLLMSNGSPMIFVTSPISLMILIVAIVTLMSSVIPWLKGKRKAMETLNYSD
jgi:putative tricarboxylic transport membrane protein